MTIQELVGKAQKAIRDAEEAIRALNEIIEAINLETNGFEIIELTVDAAYQLLMAGESPGALSMKYNGQPVADIEKASEPTNYYCVYWYLEQEDPNSLFESHAYLYKQGDDKCITMVAPK